LHGSLFVRAGVIDNGTVAGRPKITATAITGAVARWTNTATNNAEQIGAFIVATMAP